MPRRPGQLDERSFARHLRELERVGSDSRVRVELAARGAIDLAGNVIPRHVYRLECGHMEQVHGTALPTATRELHCPRCGRWRPIVEHLT